MTMHHEATKGTKTYLRGKTVDELRDACAGAGLRLDSLAYDNRGSDWVTVEFTHAGQPFEVIYSSFNGNFLGKLPGSNAIFSERSTDLDGEPWYQALMDFLYVPALAGAPAKMEG